MILDGRTVTADTKVDTDLCIVGGGPAGIVLALQFATSSQRVCLLESGGAQPGEDPLDIAKGENVGLEYYDLEESHARVLGGLSQIWGGWLRPLEPFDMEHRPWVYLSGWPFEYSELEPYYHQAQALLSDTPFNYAPSDWTAQTPPLYTPPVAGPELQVAIWQKLNPPFRFGDVFRAQLERARNISVYLHSSALRVVPDSGGQSIERVEVVTGAGNHFTVSAKQFVIAAGGFGSARLLLNSEVGGQAVGRYFMEHPHLPVARVNVDRTSKRSETMPAIDYGLRGAPARLALERPQRAIKCAYALTPAAQQQHEVLNISMHLRGYSRPTPGPAARLAAGFRQPVKTLRAMPMRGEFGLLTQTTAFLRTLPTTVAVGYERFLKRPDAFEIYVQAEQAPDPASHLSLSDEVDALGMPRLRLDWRLGDLEKATLVNALTTLDAALSEAGVGRVEPYEWVSADAADWGADLSGGHHHLGTTRMSGSMNHGVVDKNTRVHGIANLYVTGPSVFPTGGFSNPMLTVVALAFRLADHLKHKAERPAEIPPPSKSKQG